MHLVHSRYAGRVVVNRAELNLLHHVSAMSVVSGLAPGGDSTAWEGDDDASDGVRDCPCLVVL